MKIVIGVIWKRKEAGRVVVFICFATNDSGHLAGMASLSSPGPCLGAATRERQFDLVRYTVILIGGSSRDTCA